MTKIKKFLAPNIPEALRLIKREMGEDALILGTSRRRRGDEKGNRVEVVAAEGGKQDTASRHNNAPISSSAHENGGIATMGTLDREIVSELRHIETRLKEILETLVVPSRVPIEAAGDPLSESLMNAGFDPSVLESKRDRLLQGQPTMEALVKRLLFGLSIEAPDENTSAFLGPSGAGKSTSVLKMARRLSASASSKPMVIYFGSEDCRDTAWLKAQCKKLGVKFSMVSKASNLEKIVTKKSSRPILIDTPSISNLREEDLQFLIALSRRIEGMKIRLVLDASMDSLNMCAIASCVPAGARMKRPASAARSRLH
jgi:flagellar biosynthesis protein FlhF